MMLVIRFHRVRSAEAYHVFMKSSQQAKTWNHAVKPLSWRVSGPPSVLFSTISFSRVEMSETDTTLISLPFNSVACCNPGLSFETDSKLGCTTTGSIALDVL